MRNFCLVQNVHHHHLTSPLPVCAPARPSSNWKNWRLGRGSSQSQAKLCCVCPRSQAGSAHCCTPAMAPGSLYDLYPSALLGLLRSFHFAQQHSSTILLPIGQFSPRFRCFIYVFVFLIKNNLKPPCSQRWAFPLLHPPNSAPTWHYCVLSDIKAWRTFNIFFRAQLFLFNFFFLV